MPVPLEKNFETEKSANICTLDEANLTLHLGLNSFEKEVLLKACKSYRAKIPSYLQSKQPELDAIDRIIQQLI